MRASLPIIRIPAPLILVAGLLAASVPARADTILLPEGTIIYGELGEKVTSSDPIGHQPDAHVWRDVKVGGITVIEAGSPIVAEVTSASPRGIGGQSGDIEITALHVIVHDQEVILQGGYGQEEPDSQMISSALGVAGSLSGMPFGGFGAFMPGRKAKLEEGLIFNIRIPADTYIEIPDEAMPTLNLRPAPGLTIGVVYQEITAISTSLPLSIRLCGQDWSDDISVEKVNDESVRAIPASVTSVESEGDCHTGRASVELEALKQRFQPGINRFSVNVNGLIEEVVLNVEI